MKEESFEDVILRNNDFLSHVQISSSNFQNMNMVTHALFNTILGLGCTATLMGLRLLSNEVREGGDNLTASLSGSSLHLGWEATARTR